MLLGAPGLTTRNKEATSVKKRVPFASVHRYIKVSSPQFVHSILALSVVTGSNSRNNRD